MTRAELVEAMARAISGAPFPTKASARKAAAALATIEAAGFAVVPREATPDMLEKAKLVRIGNARYGDDTDPDEYYRAMIAASPISTPRG
jgi:hypothetical protein